MFFALAKVRGALSPLGSVR